MFDIIINVIGNEGHHKNRIN